ncbi:stage IV sporulation protein A [Heliophilum fasciatum]|uniref:Stage IV sporulation protein A n=1 Tax=Heliophilum fasciatum TaxID=35700 RepID=A0A4R2RG22_9FIRM|nr:stage IV sporulation protein A [Heliophilum fasciatum]MCW2278667.1 stage IV sporulation protein A [Heliophilum fasciatum]TCP62612.1 stage IV sporulation protein A [Heliophilum fasciatum]
MEKLDIFRDISDRTGGDIYIGVVGPVRTGKSTFIKRFMELLVLPNIKNVHDKERARDELPQSGAGRTITTTEPKFIPNEAVEIGVKNGIKMRVRMVDCVGYSVDGALGYEEEAGPRMVMTPWSDEEMPFQDAAEIGTRKVIADHSTIGIVMVSDGSVTDLPREAYVEAEERVVQELKELRKPFVVILNSTRPHTKDTAELAYELEGRYQVPVLPLNVATLDQHDVLKILEEALYEFPVTEVNINLPLWIEELSADHAVRQQFEQAVRDTIAQVKRLRDIDLAVEQLGSFDFVNEAFLQEMNLGSGAATIEMTAPEGMFYEVLQSETGLRIGGEHDLLRLMKELTMAKREFDKVAGALEDVRQNGYGMVNPSLEEMSLEEPELIKQGSRFGVKLKASAPSLHIIRADITTEITPIIGTEKQCEELVRYMLDEFEENPQKIWESNIFGKSLHDLVREGVQNKLQRMPENVQGKLQETLQRIVNDGHGGLICIII